VNDTSSPRDRSRDTGLALVLLLLIVHAATRRDGFATAAIVVLVAAMTVPLLFRPASVVWFGFFVFVHPFHQSAVAGDTPRRRQ